MTYNIDWAKFVEQWWNKWGTPKVLAWNKALLKPIADLHTEFLAYREEQLYNINMNGQVCYLTKLLNDLFDPSGNGITITTPTLPDSFIIYDSRAFGVPVLEDTARTGQVLLNYRSGGGDYDFQVIVPIGLVINWYQMAAYINKYRLATKKYQIIQNGLIKYQSQ